MNIRRSGQSQGVARRRLRRAGPGATPSGPARRPGARRRAPEASEGSVAGYSSPACYLHEFEPAPSSPGAFEIKRIYDPPSSVDGFRVLVDRLWPRGVSRKRAALDEWRPELAPSAALRTWFHRDLERWPQFGKRYRAELRAQGPLLQALRLRARRQRVTLLYAARDAQVNHAVVLRDVLCRSSRATSERASAP